MKIEYPGFDAAYSLHNHSNFSDGCDSLEDMVKTAKDNGIKVFGISDHWCKVPYDGTDYAEWCMKHEKLDEYVAELLRLKKKYDDENFELKLGLEVEFFFENINEVMAELAKYPFDYFIGSVHYADTFPIDHDIADWIGLGEFEKDKICKTYWQKIAGAADCGYFTFIGHLDLPKKFAFIDENKYFPDAVKVLDIIAARNGAIEVNTAGKFKNCASAYPSLKILEEANKRRIPVVISADAHAKEHLNRAFAEIGELLKQAKYI